MAASGFRLSGPSQWPLPSVRPCPGSGGPAEGPPECSSPQHQEPYHPQVPEVPDHTGGLQPAPGNLPGPYLLPYSCARLLRPSGGGEGPGLWALSGLGKAAQLHNGARGLSNGVPMRPQKHIPIFSMDVCFRARARTHARPGRCSLCMLPSCALCFGASLWVIRCRHVYHMAYVCRRNT